jgi:7-cyano-7-deazaguanine reductase
MDLHQNLQALGNSAVNKPLYEKQGVDKSVLERFPSPFAVSNPSGCAGTVTITAPEFTSLCPLTGQPDFATIVVEYIPRKWCVESKAWKLYLGSFRSQGEFHESCVNRMCNDLIELLDPEWIKVTGQFTPRGGIAFWPEAEWGNPDAE